MVANEGAVVNEAQPDKQPAKAKRAVFRIPGAAILAIGLFTFGLTPVAWTVPGMLALYAIPVALLYWVLRVRTTATPEGLTVRTLFGRGEVSWSDLKGVTVTNKGKVYAVTTAGAEMLLPTVRSNNIPALSLISDGRLPDPTGLTADVNTPESSDKPDD